MTLNYSIANIILNNIYWASLIFIGYVFLRLFLSILNKKSLTEHWSGIPFFAKLPILFSVVSVIFCVWTVFGYVFKMPPIWLPIIYFSTLTTAVSVSIMYLIKKKNSLYGINSLIKQLLNIRLISLTTVLLVLVSIGYIMSILIGSYLDGDAQIHLSKIRHLFTDGFTFTDMYFGTVPETRYTVSLLHTLLAVPGYFGLDPIDSWLVALAPLKLIFWSSVCYLAWYIYRLVGLKGKRLNSLAIFTVIFVVAATLLGPITFTYPNEIVVIWIILYVIGMMDLFVAKNYLLLIIASILITFTHPLAAVAVVLMTGIVIMATMIFDRKSFNKKTITVVVISLATLMIMPIFTQLQPNNMSEDAYNYGVDSYNLISVFGTEIFKPSIGLISGTVKLPIILSVLSIIGLAYIIFSVKNKMAKIVITSSVLFVPLVLYNPFSMLILTKFFPFWSIVRFPVVNIITFISLPVGIAAITFFVIKLCNKNYIKSETIILVIVSLSSILIISHPFGPDGRWMFKHNQGPRKLISLQNKEIDKNKNIRKLMHNFNEKSVVSSWILYGRIVPAVSPQYVVAITPGNSTPAADSSHRIPCNKKMLMTLDRSLMKQAGVDYILTSDDQSLYKNMINKPSEFNIEKSEGKYYIFSINYHDIIASNDKTCVFYEK